MLCFKQAIVNCCFIQLTIIYQLLSHYSYIHIHNWSTKPTKRRLLGIFTVIICISLKLKCIFFSLKPLFIFLRQFVGEHHLLQRKNYVKYIDTVTLQKRYCNTLIRVNYDYSIIFLQIFCAVQYSWYHRVEK